MLKIFNDLVVSDNLDEVMASPNPITSDYFISVYIERGAVQFTLEGQTYHANEGDFVVGLVSNMIGSVMRTPDLQGKLICGGEHLFDDALAGILHLDSEWWKKFLFLQKNPVIHLTEYQNKLFQAYFNLMMTYMEDSDNPYRQRIIRLTAQSIAVEVLHQLQDFFIDDEGEACAKTSSSQKDRLFQRFMTLLNRPDNTEREVKAYAEQMLVTPKYLSAVCKEKSGRTALEWVTEATVRNIKYYLQQTNLTTKEIAYKMDFPDVSFFCKYTKKHLGKTPMEYRYRRSSLDMTVNQKE